MQNQQMNQDKPTTLQDAIRQLDTTRTLQQVRELCAAVDAGFVSDVPTVLFSDSDWPQWNIAIQRKVESFAESDAPPSSAIDNRP